MRIIKLWLHCIIQLFVILRHRLISVDGLFTRFKGEKLLEFLGYVRLYNQDWRSAQFLFIIHFNLILQQKHWHENMRPWKLVLKASDVFWAILPFIISILIKIDQIWGSIYHKNKKYSWRVGNEWTVTVVIDGNNCEE